LQEISPLLPPEVLNDFKRKYANDKDISKPEEANGLEKIEVYGGTPKVSLTENPMRRGVSESPGESGTASGIGI
jgi:hypothetical protein